MASEEVRLVEATWPREVDVVELVEQGVPPGPAGASGIDPELDVRFLAPESGAPPQVYRGLQGLIEGWRDWLEPWASYRLQIEEYVDGADGEVLALARVVATTHRGGVEVEHHPAAVWTVSGGRIVRVRFFLDRDDARRAAGLDGD